jgi:hypothetical protein
MFGLYPEGITVLAPWLLVLFVYIWPNFKQNYLLGRYTRKSIRELKRAKNIDISKLGEGNPKTGTSQ